MLRVPLMAFAAVLIVLPGFAQEKADEPITTTLCELVKTPERFNEEIIQVRALILRGMESIILYDEACDADARVSLEWPEDSDDKASIAEQFDYAFIRTRNAVKHPNRLRWRRRPSPVKLVKDDAYAQFEAYLNEDRPQVSKVLCVSCPLYSVTATMTGRFEHASLKAIRDRSNKIEIVEPFGFGHLNMWNSQLVLQSVSDVVAKPLAPSVYEKKK